MNKGVVEFAVRDKSKPLGIATYKTLKSIPKPYRSLVQVFVQRQISCRICYNTSILLKGISTGAAAAKRLLKWCGGHEGAPVTPSGMT